MKAMILVPFRPDGEVRSRNWAHAEAWWRQLGLPICEGDSRANEPFDVTQARNAAAAGATQTHPDWDVALMTDSDAFLASHRTAEVALDTAYVTGKYVVAHNRLLYLDTESTKRILSGEPVGAVDWIAAPTTWETVFAFRRDLWEEIGGFDPRFRGFGHQVEAFFHAAQTLAGAKRMTGFCYHLAHPYSADAENPHLAANSALVERYWAASGDKTAMRSLLAEYAVVPA